MNDVQETLRAIYENPKELASRYAGKISGKRVRLCKKCNNRGYLEFTAPAGKTIIEHTIVCECVLANIKSEALECGHG